jgi:hypothetical protein
MTLALGLDNDAQLLPEQEHEMREPGTGTLDARDAYLAGGDEAVHAPRLPSSERDRVRPIADPDLELDNIAAHANALHAEAG